MGRLVLHPDQNIHLRYSDNLFDPVEFNRLVDDLRAQYNGSVDDLSQQLGQSPDWWFTATASRNTFQSKLFLNYCYFFYAIQKLCDSSLSEIIVSSKALQQSLIQNKIHSVVRVENPVGSPHPLREFYRGFQFLKTQCVRKFWTTVFKHRRPLDKNMRLVDVTIREDSFQNGVFKDRYFGDFISSTYKQNRWTLLGNFYATIGSKALFRKTRNSEIPFCLKEDFLNFVDLLWALSHSFRVLKFLKTKWIVNSYDLSSLLRKDLRDHRSGTCWEAALNYRFTHRLKMSGIHLELYLDWFENQDIDKALLLGLRKIFPNCRRIGYQGFGIFPNYLGLTPTPVEKLFGVLPDILAVTGAEQQNYQSQFIKDLPIRRAPSFRFQHVFKEMPNRPEFLLALLPVSIEDSRDLLEIVRNHKFKNWRIRIHPASPITQIQKLILGRGLADKVSSSSLEEDLLSAQAIVTNTSGTALEGICWKIPVILVGSPTQISKYPYTGKLKLPIIYKPEELDSALQQSHISKEQADALREMFFTEDTNLWRENFLSSVDG